MKPWKVIRWVIPPHQSGQFVGQMEQVFDVYKRPYDKDYPVNCMDESPKQLIKETRTSLMMRPGSDAKVDYEYERCGIVNVFMASEPLQGKRYTEITELKTKRDWAIFIQYIAEVLYRDAKKITCVLDNFSTHSVGAFYETFEPQEAQRILNRLEFVYTPKHGSWLNMAEIELNVLMGQCLNRRIDNIKTLQEEVRAWECHRNNINSKINWQFTTHDARIKLKRLYPTIVNY